MRTLIVYSVLFHLLVIHYSAHVIISDYTVDRKLLLQAESELSLGGSIQLTEKEINANEILMLWKNKEIEDAYNNTGHLKFSKHFFTYINDICKSKVYQIIRSMPKGAALHVHASMMLHTDSLFKLTYEDHLYACLTDDDLKLHFSYTVPSQLCSGKWNLLSELRSASDDVEQFDAELRQRLTLYTEDEDLLNADINQTWERFNKVYKTIKSLITYRPVREKFFYKALESFYNDNVMYIEIRSGLHDIYELNGTMHHASYLAELYQRITNQFIQKHPDFIGIKLILTTGRWKSIESVRETLDMARRLKKEMPKLIAGFDLVGQEDMGKPLIDFLPALVEAKNDIDFFFHGGETNWFGTSADENLLDAIMLGTKRIGHAYSLLKHPRLSATMKQNDIAIEVNVVSNVVLSLVRDVRNHPLATYLSLGYPVVLSSDDPGAWDADPLSHDFYVTFVGVASKHADIRLLKKLALNSIRYSALDAIGKSRLYNVFEKRWEIFVKNLIARQEKNL